MEQQAKENKPRFGGQWATVVASLAPLLVFEVAVFPYLIRRVGTAAFGAHIVAESLINTFVSALGFSLATVRVRRAREYGRLSLRGDFAPLAVVALAVCAALSALICLCFAKISYVDKGLLTVFAVTSAASAYLSCAWRRRPALPWGLIRAGVCAVFAVIGMLLTRDGGHFGWALALSGVAGCAFCLFASPLWREPFELTPLFSGTARDWARASALSFSAGLGKYADILAVFILLGAKPCVQWFSSTFFTRIAVFAGMVAGSMLISRSRDGGGMTQRRYKKIYWLSALGSLVLTAVAYFCAPWLAKVLFVMTSLNRTTVTLACAGALITGAAGFMQSIIFRVCPPARQGVVQGIYIAVLFIMGGGLSSRWGLQGFCIGAIVAGVVRMIMMLDLAREFLPAAAQSDARED